MIRALHRWPGLLALALVSLLALSGVGLSLFPAAERLAAPRAEAGLSVATLASRVASAYPGVEQIKRAPSGRITAYWFDGGAPGAAVIDPATGRGIADAGPGRLQRWLTVFHRSLFMEDLGRAVTALGAALMLLLSLSGVVLIARRAGGWRNWFKPFRGPFAGRLHAEIARAAVAGLVLSSATALWMTAATFDLLPDDTAIAAAPAATSGKTGVAIDRIAALAETPVNVLRELTFPDPADPSSVYALKTGRGSGEIDQGTGAMLVWTASSSWERFSETVYMLHTGQGAPVLGLVLGLMAFGVPAMGVTGALQWLSGRRGRPRLRGNQPAAIAETILLVASEGGSTWGFAATLHQALRAAGQTVHAAPLSAFDPARYASARRMIILAATYGDGDAPASAAGFLGRLGAAKARGLPLAVLGFGDRGFPRFCGFAAEIAARAKQLGWPELLPFATVDRQSAQDFAGWGRGLGKRLGIELNLVHLPPQPDTHSLTLLSRRGYGAEVQAPTAILRFALPRAPLWRRLTGRGFGRFQAGDLLAVVPGGSTVARFYSLASGTTDGFIEIAVRRQPGGLCSGELMALAPGGTVSAFLKRNSRFHARAGRTPLILIGAGAGIAPLAGFIRANARRRPVHLFFGMRHQGSDFLYGEELERWLGDGRLKHLATATSRGERPHYVQDALRLNSAEVAWLINAGARVMVCGGREMAAGASEALSQILLTVGLTLDGLKAEGRHVEDVY
jgi:sulfite reductase (NADPH) flavoprotein alpha-component